MPLNKCKGGTGWRYGTHGTCYTGPDAKKKAMKQAMAIEASGFVEKADIPVEIAVEITKHDAERQFVFGWANVSMADGELVIDSHGDTISPEELENAAYEFSLNFNAAATGEMHKGEAKGRLIESFMVTPEKLEKMGFTSASVQTGWWVGMYVEDQDLFAKVKSGKYRALSIQGMARRIKDNG